jgi:DNA replication protein DnaC
MYNSKITDEAIKILKNRRINAQTENKSHFDEVHMTVPEISKITKELAQTSVKLMQLMRDFTGQEREKRFQDLRMMNLDFQNKLENLLLQNNYPKDFLDIQYYCKKCNDTGYIDGVICQCLQELFAEIALKELSKVSQSGNCSFQNFNLNFYKGQKSPNGKDAFEMMRNNFEYCKKYAETFSENSKSLFMVGLTGLGKTHLSLAIANVVVKKNFNTICSSIVDILRNIENQHFSKTKSENDILKDILTADFLIMDDLGTEFKTEFTESTLYNIINTRINEHKPTIISTNLTIEEIQNRYNTRITSRLLFNYHMLPFVGADVRQLKQRF